MSNKFENYPAEEFVKLCFADDSGKIKNEDGYRFWKNFAELRVDVWEKDCPKIYNYKNSYDALPDPDVNSYNLYEAHIRAWNIQHKKFNNKNIKDIERDGRCCCQIRTVDKQIILGSDSIMSIYWHRKYGNTPQIMEEISKDEKLESEINELKKRLNLKNEKDVDRCFNDNFSLYQKFLWYYLQYTNTIGGFILFPRHDCSINQRRGRRPIDDRFDLTLECIRRMYENCFPTGSNPLFDISKEDKEYFEMFGSFENYTKFFCLDKSWVKEGKVLNLLNNEPLEEWDFNQQEPLPQNSEEWWTFYRNIMNRLDARNQQIKEIIERK